MEASQEKREEKMTSIFIFRRGKWRQKQNVQDVMGQENVMSAKVEGKRI